jgi:hypothetical protein
MERTQVYVKTAFETVRFEFKTIEEFGKQIEDRWGLRPGHYRIHPTPRENQSGVGYGLIPLVKGGYGSDDDDDTDDVRETLPRFPEQPNFGPRDIWDKAKCWIVRLLSREHPEWSDRQTLEVVVGQVRQHGWPWLAEVFVGNVREEVRRRLEDNMPMSPSCFAIRDHFVSQWMESGWTRREGRSVFNRKVVVHGWEHFTGVYREESNEPEYVETVFNQYVESAQWAFPRKTTEQIIQDVQRNWVSIRNTYEQKRIQKEWSNFQRQIIAEQRRKAQESGEDFDLDIEDDQGVTAMTREWVNSLLKQADETAEDEMDNVEENAAEPESEVAEENPDEQQVEEVTQEETEEEALEILETETVESSVEETGDR